MTTPFVEANGARIPAIGLGTWDLRERTCVRMVEQALRLGYRHIDTAEMYGNEREVGEGIRASGIPRAQIFVTTKVWPDHLAPREFERATKESLAKLRLSEVDLLLIHWPNPRIPLADTIGALCRMKREGFTRHIGVSNFTVELLEQAVKLATEPLVTDQFESGQELARREALRLYGVGILQERASKLIEAVKSLEAARRLDPESAAVHKALVPIYLALDRMDDALAKAARRVGVMLLPTA